MSGESSTGQIVRVSCSQERRPICVAEHLAPFLPSHPLVPIGGDNAINAVAAAPYGSASILLISWAYIKMLGGDGLSASSAAALLNANYMAHRLSGHYTLRYKNGNGRVAHELLIDLAEFEKSAGLKVTDFAKRLQVSISVVYVACLSNNTLPGLRLPPAYLLVAHLDMHADRAYRVGTSGRDRQVCFRGSVRQGIVGLRMPNRFCDAMIQIRKEAEDIISGKQPKDNNVLKNAPHPISVIALPDDQWNR